MRRITGLMLLAAILVTLVGCSRGDKEVKKEVSVTGEKGHYTYSTNAEPVDGWSPLVRPTVEQQEILSYTTSPLYEAAVDEEGKLVPAPVLAAGLPEDVTPEYAGDETYGVPGKAEKGYAWKITLRDGAAWEDGSAITAKDFVDTLRIYLEPTAPSERAQDFCSGILAIANAQTYLEQNYIPVYGANKKTAKVADEDLFFCLNLPLPYLNNATFAEYYQYYSPDYPQYFRAANGRPFYARLLETAGSGYVKVNANIKKWMTQFCRSQGDKGKNSYKKLCCYRTGEADWEKVGIKAKSDREMVLILENPVSAERLAYALRDFWLVRVDLYNSDKEGYGCSADRYQSYGPYRITSYSPAGGLKLERNTGWFGYADGNYEGQYQTTDIELRYGMGAETAMETFGEGNLQRVLLSGENAAKYSEDEHYVKETTDGSSYLWLESDFDLLGEEETGGNNHQILGYRDFRFGLSLAISRSSYAKQFTEGAIPQLGLLSDACLTDAAQSTAYRSAKTAQNVLVNLYGLKDRSQLDSLKGYDVKKASKLFQKAYDVCMEDGRIAETDPVELTFYAEGAQDSGQKEMDFIQQAITSATAGTDLENRVSLRLAKEGEHVDILRRSMVMDCVEPDQAMAVFCRHGEPMEAGLMASVQTLSIKLDGKKVTKTLEEWQKVLSARRSVAKSDKNRIKILAGFEQNLLENAVVLPLYQDAWDSVYSQRIDVQSASGGVRYLTYSMDDAGWADYCAENEYHVWKR